MNDMNVWQASSVEETPSVVLTCWRIFEVTTPYHDLPTRHFVGYNETEGEGRASSAIQEFDKNTMQGITRSGRVYRLTGESGMDRDALYVWHRWSQVNHVETVKDITEEFKNA
jgi:hypothetical protein